jgi:hypothetical protein
MILHRGNYWDYYQVADLFLFTGNSTVKDNGKLVMGAGTARQVRDQFSGIDQKIGKEIIEGYPPINNKIWKREYLLLVSPGFSKKSPKKIGAFQVKYYWKNSASLKLIEKSCFALIRFMDAHPGLNIFLPFPGIGNGNKSFEEVFPIVNILRNYEKNEKNETGLSFWVSSNASFDLGSFTPQVTIVEC